MERRGEAFDYILLETTGLADPGNIAPVFWVDDGLGSTIYLDGIVTLVDASNLLRSLDQPVGEEAVEDDQDKHPGGPHLSIAHLQISHADVIVINKVDLVSTAQLEKVVERVRSINAIANIHLTDHSQVPRLEGLVLDLHAYDDVSVDALDFASKGHSHLDTAIGTVSVSLPTLSEGDLQGVDRWLQQILWNNSIPGYESLSGWEIHRSKGRIVMSDGTSRMLQGVREIFELVETASEDTFNSDSKSTGKVVFIGRKLNEEEMASAFQQSLNQALNTS